MVGSKVKMCITTLCSIYKVKYPGNAIIFAKHSAAFMKI